MVAMERDKYGNLKNTPIFSGEDANTLIQQSLEDAKNRKLCGMELLNPAFFCLATQELKIMLNDMLEKGNY